MDECKPRVLGRAYQRAGMCGEAWEACLQQGLTLVHFSAQRKRYLWDKGCIEGLFRGCLGGVRGY